jgi:hypothetical protein
MLDIPAEGRNANLLMFWSSSLQMSDVLRMSGASCWAAIESPTVKPNKTVEGFRRQERRPGSARSVGDAAAVAGRGHDAAIADGVLRRLVMSP